MRGSGHSGCAPRDRGRRLPQIRPQNRPRGIATALVGRIVDVLRARGAECLEVTANPHAREFYNAAGFIDCGVAETDFGAAPRMRLAIH